MKIASILSVALVGCTLLPESPEGQGQVHTSVLPAVVICVFAQCEAQFADRAARAGQDSVDSSETDSDMEEDSNAVFDLEAQ